MDQPVFELPPVETASQAVAAERRGPADRRRQPTPMWSRYTWLGGRRRGGRRHGESDGIFVDLYGHALFVAVLTVVALNILDAFFTLFFLSYGGQELNPVVDFVLRYGPVPFLILKSLGIGLCVAFLSLTIHFRTARIGLGVVMAGYLLLLGWHLHLLDWLSL